jgi:hypothetical protein
VETSIGRVCWFYDIDWWNGDNEISSVQNNTNQIVMAWTNDNPTGRSFCIGRGKCYTSLGNLDHDFESFIVVDA